MALSPWWVTGLADGEGCFFAGVYFRTKASPTGSSHECVNLDTCFQVWLRADDLRTLESLQSFFGCGSLYMKPKTKSRISGANDAAAFRVSRIEEIVEHVIPHFDDYPLQSKKLSDYEVWKDLIMYVDKNLRGKKGWLRRFPEEVENVVDLCERLKSGREYKEAANVR